MSKLVLLTVSNRAHLFGDKIFQAEVYFLPPKSIYDVIAALRKQQNYIQIYLFLKTTRSQIKISNYLSIFCAFLCHKKIAHKRYGFEHF